MWSASTVLDDRRAAAHYDLTPMADRSPQALGWLALDDHGWDRGLAMPHRRPHHRALGVSRPGSVRQRDGWPSR